MIWSSISALQGLSLVKIINLNFLFVQVGTSLTQGLKCSAFLLNPFLSHKITFMTNFSSISTKKTFFWETKKFYVFYAFWTLAIILRKVVRGPADKTLTKKNFDFK